jgi:hypothetical protein
MRFNARIAIVALAGVLAAPFAANAQTSESGAEPSARGKLDTVTVTARKRKEELQKNTIGRFGL